MLHAIDFRLRERLHPTLRACFAFAFAVVLLVASYESINAQGKISITVAGGNRISFNEMTSSVTLGNRTVGVSNFLGLNDFFASSKCQTDCGYRKLLELTAIFHQDSCFLAHRESLS